MGLRKRARDLAFLAGINLHQIRCLGNVRRYIRDWRAYERQRKDGRFPLALRDAFPILIDFHTEAGVAAGHYFHQDLWAARRIFEARPVSHVDVGSRIDGFVAHLLTFMPVTVVDIRPLTGDVRGLSFERGDLTHLDRMATGSVESLSSLHAVEHVGLGRYGDAIDPDGWKKALSELARALAPNGRLYLSVPVGVERMRFNGDRIFAPRTIVEALAGLRLLHFNVVDEAGPFHEDAALDAVASAENACGLFEFTKER
jgi:SAM-dependent methyltransferase